MKFICLAVLACLTATPALACSSYTLLPSQSSVAVPLNTAANTLRNSIDPACEDETLSDYGYTAGSYGQRRFMHHQVPLSRTGLGMSFRGGNGRGR